MNEYKILTKLQYKTAMNRHDGFNIGAVVVDRQGCILSYGFNSYHKTHPSMIKNVYYNDHQIFVHAECDALYSVDPKTQPFAIIICRLNKKNEFMNAKPCTGCYLEILKSGIKRIYYTNFEGELTLINAKTPVELYV